MTILSAPDGFERLTTKPCVLYYRIEEDGGVMITGPHPQRCLFKEALKDGSVVEGGWTPNMGGTVFGERWVKDRMGNLQKKPLRWCPIDEVKDLPVPSERRKPIVPKHKPAEKKAPEPDMMPETRQLLEAFEREREDKKRAAEAKNKWSQRFNPEPSKRSREPVLSRPSVDPEKVIAGLKTENERLQREHQKMKREVEELRVAMRQVEKANHDFKEQAKTIRDDAINEVRKIRDDYERKSTITRWLVEAAPSKEMRIEGLEAKVWEIEDPDRELRYLVVASTPRGTEKRVEEQWMADLKDVMERRFGDSLYYVIIPPEAKVHVHEVKPGINDQIVDDADYGQF